MRVLLRVVGMLLGLVVVILGAAAMVVVGPDDTITTDEHLLGTNTSAITSAPHLLQYYGPTLHVSAESTTAKPVFVGVAGQVDADSYLADTPRGIVDEFRVPWSLHARTADIDGNAEPVPPAGLDFWVASASGRGERSVAWPIANGPYTVVIMNADASPDVSVRLRVGLEIEHAFISAAVVAGAGLLLILAAALLLRRRTPRSGPEVAR